MTIYDVYHIKNPKWDSHNSLVDDPISFTVCGIMLRDWLLSYSYLLNKDTYHSISDEVIPPNCEVCILLKLERDNENSMGL